MQHSMQCHNGSDDLSRDTQDGFRSLFRPLLRPASSVALILALAACGSVPQLSESQQASPAARRAPAPISVTRSTPADVPKLPPAGSGRGAYYQDDGPGDETPEGLHALPDAEPRIEPYSKRGNRPYVVFGKTYTPITDNEPFKQRGRGSWYGKKFHGQKTSSGELYDMYKMTAAHPTLPIPSYARVTNVANGAQVIVRVNDRGPFHSSRVIDLSYTAALKLGYIRQGSAVLEVERLLAEDIARMAEEKAALAKPAEQAAASLQPELRAEPKLEQKSATQIAVESMLRNDISPASSPAFQGRSTGAAAMAATLQQPSVDAAVASSVSGFYLQLGAFAQIANAEAVRSRLKQEGAVALPMIEVVQSGGVYRIFSGPFVTRDEAVVASDRLQQAGVSRPLIVQR